MKTNKVFDTLNTSFNGVSSIIDCSRVIGKPIMVGEFKAIVPIAKITFGMGAGGSEFSFEKKKTISKKNKNELLFENGEENFPYGGGSISGVSMMPEAFLIIDQDKTEIVYMKKDNTLFQKCLDLFIEFMKKK